MRKTLPPKFGDFDEKWIFKPKSYLSNVDILVKKWIFENKSFLMGSKLKLYV